MNHKSKSPIFIGLGSIAVTALIFAQGPPPGLRTHTENKAKPLKLVPANRKAPEKNEVSIEIKDDFRVITSNNMPDHKVGKFPNSGNPNTMSEQAVEIKLPLKPEMKEAPTPIRGSIGILVNGVYLDPGTAEVWASKDGETIWNYEALGGAVELGLDANYAHVQPGGKYHYHGQPTGYLSGIKLTTDKHSPIIGWAFDGFPIYANYGYEDPQDPNSKIVSMKSSYGLKAGDRPRSPSGPGGKYDGAFVQDYEFVKDRGTLDECNGRFTKTPEFPDGTYAYFLTSEWPVIPRSLRGEPAFKEKNAHGGGGNGGPGGEFGHPPHPPHGPRGPHGPRPR